MPLQSGTIVGDYEIIRLIGQGGMGKVYLARDTALDRSVAIKTIMASYEERGELVQRFQREARAAARLIHANIVQIYRVDVDNDPPYMAMEFVDGRSVERIVLDDGPLSWQRMLNVISQVASALVAAHAEGIIHRDIKPGNIMVNKKNRVKVTDFGLAKVLDSSLHLTRDSLAIGSPCYMSPEQCGVGEVGPASDIFSLGVTAYEMVTGRLPFQADSAFEMMRKITSERIPTIRDLVPEVPLVVQELIEHMAERRTQSRYQSAQDLLEDLKSLRAHQPLRHLEELKGSGTVQSEIPTQPPTPVSSDNNTPAPPSLTPTTPVPALAALEIESPTFGTPRPQFDVERRSPLRRAAIIVSAVAILAIVGTVSALIALRLAVPPRPGQEQAPPSGANAQFSGNQPPPVNGTQARYPRGLSPLFAPPEDTEIRRVWDSIYGPGGKFEGRQDLTDEEIEQLPDVSNLLPPTGPGGMPPPRRQQ